MEYYIQTFLSLCLGLSLIGAVLWFLYLAASAVMFVFPYALAVVLGSLGIVAFIAWRRSRGH